MEVLERPRSRDQKVQALVGTYPDGIPGGSRQSTYTIVYERVRALRIVLQMFNVSRERVNDVDPGISGTDPDAARVVGELAAHEAAVHAVGSIGQGLRRRPRSTGCGAHPRRWPE